MSWTQEEAIQLCKSIESTCPLAGCHVALTGGCLYKKDQRKDCDLLFYRIRQVSKINLDTLFGALEKLGIKVISGKQWCYKAIYKDKYLDLFFPEEFLTTTNKPFTNSRQDYL